MTALGYSVPHCKGQLILKFRDGTLEAAPIRVVISRHFCNQVGTRLLVAVAPGSRCKQVVQSTGHDGSRAMFRQTLHEPFVCDV